MKFIHKAGLIAAGLAISTQVIGRETPNPESAQCKATSLNFETSSSAPLEDPTSQVSIFDGYIPSSKYQSIVEGTSQFDATKAIQRAINSMSGTGKTLYFPPGRYLVSTIVVSGCSYKLATNGVTLQQTPGLTGDAEMHPIVLVSDGATDITIGDLRLIGNIDDDEDEYSPGIAVISAHNIQVGDIFGKDIRGDVLYVYGRTTNLDTQLRNLQVGVVYGQNIYRSIVAIVGGEVRIAGIRSLGSIGYRDLDIEPNRGGSYQPVLAQIGFVEGSTVQITSDAIETVNQRVSIDKLDLDGRRLSDSIPPYPRYPGINAVALSINRTRDVRIGTIRLKNYESFPIVLADRWQRVTIRKLEFENSDTKEDTYKSVIIQIGRAGEGLLSIQNVSGTLNAPDRFLVRSDLGLLSVHLGTVQVEGGALGAYLTGKIDFLNLGLRDPVKRSCLGCSNFRIARVK